MFYFFEKLSQPELNKKKMNKKFMSFVFVLPIIYNQQTICMDFKNHTLPIFALVTCISTALFTYHIFCNQPNQTNVNNTSLMSKLVATLSDMFQDTTQASNSINDLLMITKITHPICIKQFYNQCKKAMHNYSNNSEGTKNTLTAIEGQLSYLPWTDMTDSQREKILTAVCLLSCKHDDVNLLITTLKLKRITEKGWFALELYLLCLYTTLLYQSKTILPLLANVSYDQTYKCHYMPYVWRLHRSNNSHQITQSARTTIKQILKESYLKNSYQTHQMIAHFFETKLQLAKTDKDLKEVQELLIAMCVKDSYRPLNLLFITINNGYHLLEKHLCNLFSLTLESKNSSGQTLYHLAYWWAVYHTSIRIALERLAQENVQAVNVRDNKGETALNLAVVIHKRQLTTERHIRKRLAIDSLLKNELIDLDDIDNDYHYPLVYHFFGNPTITLCLLQHPNFYPNIYDKTNISFLREIFFGMHLWPIEEDSRKFLNLSFFKNKKMMTKELYLIAKNTRPEGTHHIYKYYNTTDCLINFCIRNGGSLTKCKKNILSPIDIARTEFSQCEKARKDGGYLQHFKNNEVKAKEIIYHLFLLKTPYSEWYETYWLMRQRQPTIPKDITKMIMNMYRHCTVQRAVDQMIATQVRKNYTQFLEKPDVIPDRQFRNPENRRLDYFEKNQQKRELYKQEIHDKLLTNITI